MESLLKEKKETFLDVDGREWRPIINTPTLMEICRKCNVNLARLIEMDINAADLLEALWCACKWQQKVHKIGREDFFINLPPKSLPLAFQSLWVAILKAFPSLDDIPMPEDLKKKANFVLGMLGI